MHHTDNPIYSREPIRSEQGPRRLFAKETVKIVGSDIFSEFKTATASINIADAATMTFGRSTTQ